MQVVNPRQQTPQGQSMAKAGTTGVTPAKWMKKLVGGGESGSWYYDICEGRKGQQTRWAIIGISKQLTHTILTTHKQSIFHTYQLLTYNFFTMWIFKIFTKTACKYATSAFCLQLEFRSPHQRFRFRKTATIRKGPVNVYKQAAAGTGKHGVRPMARKSHSLQSVAFLTTVFIIGAWKKQKNMLSDEQNECADLVLQGHNVAILGQVSTQVIYFSMDYTRITGIIHEWFSH